MGFTHILAVRDGITKSAGLTPTMVNLLIALLVIIFLGLLSVGALLYLRRLRRAREASLPMYSEKGSDHISNHKRLTLSTGSSRHSRSMNIYSEKQTFFDSSPSPPMSPDSVPQIRITFPEEEDEAGKKRSGRVVVVRVGDNGVGLEPLDEHLPPYQASDVGRFQSLDLDRPAPRR